MFCPNCGTKTDDGAQFCFRCGTKIKKSGSGTERPAIELNTEAQNAPTPTAQGASTSGQNAEEHYDKTPHKEEDKNIIALIGFILSFFVCVPAIVCSAIGLKNAKTNGGVKHGFAKAGLIISIVNTAIAIIMTIVVVVTVNVLFYQYGLYHLKEGLVYTVKFIDATL